MEEVGETTQTKKVIKDFTFGKYLTHGYFKMKIEPTNRYKKIQKQTLLKLKLDKIKVKDTI